MRTLAMMLLAVVVGVVVTGVLTAADSLPAKQENAVMKKQIAGLKECLAARTCQSKVEAGVFMKRPYQAVTLVDGPVHTTYRLFADGTLGVNSVNYSLQGEQYRRLYLVEDRDQNGLVDRMYRELPGAVYVEYTEWTREFRERSSFDQLYYMRAMQDAWFQLVPRDIKNRLEQKFAVKG